MAKKKLTLQEKLRKKKFHIPNPVVVGLYRFIMGNLVMPKYKPEIKITDDINDCDGPCFLIWNHLSRIDHAYLMKAAYPRRINIVAGYVEFFRAHLAAVFRLNQCLPKKNFAQDIPGMKAMQSIINQGGCVCFSPEGMSSIYGTNQPVVAGSGHFIKHYGIPVYFVEMHGQYLQNTKHCLDERYGKTVAEMKLLFTKEDLERMTDDEVEAKINEAFRNDDFEWGKANHIKWKTRGEICKNMNQILYRCPKCGKEMTIEAEKDYIKCTACGNGATMDDYYEFHPYDDTCVIPESPSKWMLWQREQVIDEIRADKNFSYTVHGKLGDIPEYSLLKKKESSRICGEGDITFDHQGIHFVGTKRGEEFKFDLNYGIVYSLVIEVGTDRFAFYVGNNMAEIIPDDPVTGKVLLIVEEMHRLHYNTWKNFPWYDYLYEGKELGIDKK